MFAAEASQEPLPYGRWAEALGEQFAAVAETVHWRHQLVPGPHLGWPHVRARHGAGGGRRGLRLRLLHARARGSPGHDLPGRCGLHGGDSRREPRLDARSLRQRDRGLARNRGPARGDHARLGRGARRERSGRNSRARADHDGPVHACGGPLHARLARRLHGRLRGGRAVRRPRGRACPRIPLRGRVHAARGPRNGDGSRRALRAAQIR